VGYEEGGQLTEAVRRRPFSVVLFDEIEKAHPDVFNTLLQILEDGRLTDAQGRTVDFKNTVIIMTSNLGTRDLEKARAVGFSTKPDEGMDYDKMRERVTEELKRTFRPEFLNRIDEVIVFHPLSREHVKAIVDLMMKRVAEQLKAKDIEIVLTEPAKDLIAAKGYDPSLGARPLRRTIQRMIEDPLSEKLLWKEYSAATTIIADAVGEEVVFSTAPKPPETPPVELAGQQES
jgi:ATP-dependent Clp protease ATP-binding subunit ClpC